VTGPVKVVAHPGVFDRTFSGPAPGDLRYIGTPLARHEYEALGARFVLTEMPLPVAPGLLCTGHVPPLHLEPQSRAGLWRNKGHAPYRDDFWDDCSLVARLSSGSVVLTGCAHAGLTNILCKAQTLVPEGPPRVLIGGLHLRAASDEYLADLAHDIAELGVCILMPCHCTGEHATEVLAERFAGRVVPAGAGTVIRVYGDGDTEVRCPVVPASISTTR